MFYKHPPKPTKAKRIIYLISSTILGLALSVLVHVFIETMYLQWAQNAGHAIMWYGGCSLHPAIQVGLLVLGGLGGYAIGRVWWRYVYIDQRWKKYFPADQEKSGEE